MPKISICLFIIFVYVPLLIFGQQNKKNEEKNIVYLYNDSVISAERVTFHSSIFNKNYISADSLQFIPKQVKFFKTESGFYGNIYNFSILGQSSFVVRMDTGRVNLYALEPTFRNFGRGQQPLFNKAGYYNIGYNDLKRTRLKFMKEDLKDSHLSLKYIKQMRRLDYLRAGLLVGGFSMASFGFLASWGNDTTHPMLYIGGGMMVSTIIPLVIRQRKMKKTFHVYNHPEISD